MHPTVDKFVKDINRQVFTIERDDDYKQLWIYKNKKIRHIADMKDSWFQINCYLKGSHKASAIKNETDYKNRLIEIRKIIDSL